MFLVWLQRAQPDRARYQQKRVGPTNVSHTPHVRCTAVNVTGPRYGIRHDRTASK
jgi:hypothetical protein